MSILVPAGRSARDPPRHPRRPWRRRHGPSGSLGLPGPWLGSPARASGPDSDVIVVLVLTGRQFWSGRPAVVQDCSPIEKHLQAVARQLAGRSAMNLKGVRVTPGRPLELELSLWPSWLVALASAMRVPSQTAGLISTRLKTRFDAIAKHNKTNCVGRFLIKTFGTAAEEVNQFRRNAPRAATSHLWKGRTCFAFQCFGLFYSDWLSTFRIFLPIHLSIGCSNL